MTSRRTATGELACLHPEENQLDCDGSDESGSARCKHTAAQRRGWSPSGGFIESASSRNRL